MSETKRKAMKRMRKIKQDLKLVATPKSILLKLQLPRQMHRDSPTREANSKKACSLTLGSAGRLGKVRFTLSTRLLLV